MSAVRRRDADMNLVDGIWSMFPGSGALQLDDDPQRSPTMIIDALLDGSPRHMEVSASAMQAPHDEEEAALALALEMLIDGRGAGLYFAIDKSIRHQQQIAAHRTFTATPASHYSTSIFVEQLSQVVDAGRKQLAVRLAVPAPVFYRLATSDVVVLRNAQGLTEIGKTLQIDLESFVRAHNRPEAIGVVLDSDDEPVNQRFGKLKAVLEDANLLAPSSLGGVSAGTPRVGVFALPEPGRREPLRMSSWRSAMSRTRSCRPPPGSTRTTGVRKPTGSPMSPIGRNSESRLEPRKQQLER